MDAQFNSGKGSWPAKYDSIYSLDVYNNTLHAGSFNGLAVWNLDNGLPEVNPLDGVMPELKSVKAGKKKATLQWAAVEGAQGYLIYRGGKKNGKFKKIKNVKSAKTVKATDKNLKKGKKYYYKVRAYTKEDGSMVYSRYSEVNGVKIR